jgi:hypothetical protein
MTSPGPLEPAPCLTPLVLTLQRHGSSSLGLKVFFIDKEPESVYRHALHKRVLSSFLEIP